MFVSCGFGGDFGHCALPLGAENSSDPPIPGFAHLGNFGVWRDPLGCISALLGRCALAAGRRPRAVAADGEPDDWKIPQLSGAAAGGRSGACDAGMDAPGDSLYGFPPDGIGPSGTDAVPHSMGDAPPVSGIGNRSAPAVGWAGRFCCENAQFPSCESYISQKFIENANLGAFLEKSLAIGSPTCYYN